jgi:hypothetical protein
MHPGWRPRSRLCPAYPASHTIRLAIKAGCTRWERSALGISFRLADVSMVPGRIKLAVILKSLVFQRDRLRQRHQRRFRCAIGANLGSGIFGGGLPIAMMRPSSGFALLQRAITLSAPGSRWYVRTRESGTAIIPPYHKTINPELSCLSRRNTSAGSGPAV